MKKLSIWHWLILIFVTTFTVVLTIGPILAIFRDGLGSSNAASWVQAVGSVGAIVGAFWISNMQRKNAIQEKREADLYARTISAQSLATLAMWALDIMRRAWAHVEGGPTRTSGFNPERIDHIRQLIEKFVDPADSFTSTVALIFIHRLWEIRQCCDALKYEQRPREIAKLMKAHIDEAEKQLNRVIAHKTALEAECYERGVITE